MGNATILLVVLFLTGAYGAYSVFRGVRRIRMPVTYRDALLEWTEQPTLSPGRELPTWLAVSLHRLALVVIGLLAVLALLLKPESALLPFLPPFLAGMVLTMAAGLVGFFTGFSLCGPLAEARGGERHYALSNQGLLVAGQVLPWKCFSAYDPGPTDSDIRLWSGSLRGTVGALLALPSSAIREEARDIIRRYLPASSTEAEDLTRRFAFPTAMGLLCLPFIVVAAALFLAPAGLALAVDALLAWALLLLGSSLITRLIYGGLPYQAQ